MGAGGLDNKNAKEIVFVLFFLHWGQSPRLHAC